MVFLLVLATLAAPILALVVAEHLRKRRRETTKADATVGGIKEGKP